MKQTSNKQSSLEVSKKLCEYCYFIYYFYCLIHSSSCDKYIITFKDVSQMDEQVEILIESILGLLAHVFGDEEWLTVDQFEQFKNVTFSYTSSD